MFRQEACWIEETVRSLKPLPNNCKVANLGSSNTYLQQSLQPHIYQHIINPLVQNRWSIINIDLKAEDGVDIVANITDTLFGEKYADNFGLTLCTNMLEHVEDINLAVQNIYSCTANYGYILLTVPYKYKKHLDPIDNMFRPKPMEILDLFSSNSVELIASQIITITDPQYYPVKQSRYPLWGYRHRVAYWLGKRHKVSGVLLKVKKDVRHHGNV